MKDRANYHTVSLSKEYFKFSCAHFTILSKTKREHLHGHDYFLSIVLDYPADQFIDYNFFKKELKKICEYFDEKIIIPSLCSELKIEKLKSNYTIRFRNDLFSFPKRDVLFLPISNTSLEEINNYIFSLIKKNSVFRYYKVKDIVLTLKNCGQESFVKGVISA
jgi:6-pyruvoyltetrahydropterin/6-carboxytetrahydropterin synthase